MTAPEAPPVPLGVRISDLAAKHGERPAVVCGGVTRTWDGGGADNLWSNPTNWVNDLAPAAGDDLAFPPGAVFQVNGQRIIMSFDIEVARLKKDWAENARWNGIRRGYTAEDVVRLRGSLHVEHTLEVLRVRGRRPALEAGRAHPPRP